jgi:hypothetical protein
MTGGYIHAESQVIHSWGLANNLLDGPLMLSFISYFSISTRFTTLMKKVIAGLILYEMIILVLIGFNVKAITIILGPALSVVIGYCTLFFIRQTKITITHQKATGKALMAASLLFAYGCYGILYLMYYIFKTEVNDTFIIYFLVGTISSIVLAFGIYLESKRIRHLQELKLMRKELSDMYPEEKKRTPLRAAMLDFDRDQWK